MGLQQGENKKYKVLKGKKIYEKGRPINELGMVLKGRASAIGVFGKILWGSGAVLGLSDIVNDNYIFDYIAEEDCEILAYSINENYDAQAAIEENIQFSGLMISTVTRQASAMVSVYDDFVSQCSSLYDALDENRGEYLGHCKKFSIVPGDIEDVKINQIPEPGQNATIELMDYCRNLNGIPLDSLKAFFSGNSNVTYYNILITSRLIKDLNVAILSMIKYMHTYKGLLIGTEKKDLFYNYSTLALEVGKKGVDISVILRGIDKITEAVKDIDMLDKNTVDVALKDHQERMDFLYKVPDEASDEDENEFKLRLMYTESEIITARNDLKNSLGRILGYTSFDDEKKDNFIRLVTAYGNLKDRSSSDDNAAGIRRQITKLFYEIYEEVFFNYVEKDTADPIIDMFLNFGFMDERLIDESQALDLYYLNKSTGDKKIFMLKDWLTAIYRGEEEPSKSEFDIDYQENLREIKRNQLLTPEQERAYLSDQKGKVLYEINNMVKATNKITFGRVSSFCPVLSKHTLCDDLQRAYVSPDRLNSIINKVVKIDYSLFYRECMYQNNTIDNNNERIMKEVRPYFILMPNFGTRCIMWQDIAGRKKDTPARLVISAFNLEDLNEILISTFARFRWELCKNMQGARWSDITSKSLTSEYYDYLQFYKKNRDLSEKSKEKVKLIVQKKSNNFKEVFVYDYLQWVKYEANGSPRLNSFVRAILFTYCPFPAEMRNNLAENPMYAQIIKKFERDREAKLKRYENVRLNILKDNGVPGEDFDNNIRFFKM